MSDTATAPRQAKKESTIVYYEIPVYRKQKQKDTYAVNLLAPDTGDRVRVDYLFPRQVILPATSTIVTKDGTQRQIRYISGCPIIDVEEQIKRGYKPNNSDVIEILDGSFSFDKDRNKALFEFLEASNIVEREGRNEPTDPWLVRVNLGHQEAEKLNNKYIYAKAILRIEEMTEAQAYDLLLERGFVRDENITESQLKTLLSNIAETDPQAILDGIDSTYKKMRVLARKAIDKGFISISTPATISWLNGGVPGNAIVKVGDIGGEEGKFERFIDFLNTDDGHIVCNAMRDLVGDVEVQDLTGENSPDDEEEEENDEVKTVVKKKAGRPKKHKNY